jgi:hypothetical protein
MEGNMYLKSKFEKTKEKIKQGKKIKLKNNTKNFDYGNVDQEVGIGLKLCMFIT